MAISVDYAVQEAIDMSHRLHYDDNKYARGGKAEKE